MADHSKPTLTSNYSAFVDEIKGRLEDISKGFDPAKTSPINMPVDAIRWAGSANKWQRWNGSAWVDLASTYAISISGNAATSTKLRTARTIALSGGATGSASFDGSANVTISVDALNPSQLDSPVPINKGGTGATTAAQARDNLGLGNAATTSQRGMVQLATSSEATALTNSTNAITPSTLAAAIRSSNARATETVRGTTEIATTEEAQALTSDDVVITPAKLAAAFGGANQGLTSSGYQKLPGGMIIQWGASAGGASGNIPVTFPIAFPTNSSLVVGSYVGSTTGVTISVDSRTLTGCMLRTNNPSANSAAWFAVGY